MKLILFILFFSASMVSSAIDNKTLKPQVNPYALDEVIQKMEVDRSRAAQVKNLLIENRAKRREIMEKARQQVKALQSETEQKIAEILTAEELQVYDQTMDAQQQAFKKSKPWANIDVSKL